MDKYVPVKQIGRGSFGRCVLVQRKPDKKLFVLKEVNVKEMTPNERKEAMNEVAVLSVLRNPHIIAYQESFVADGVLNIVMEYAEGGDLHQAIQKRQNDKKGGFFSETEIMEWFCQISLALQYTHQKNILHRDLKTQNIFMTSSRTIKLGDFGIAKVLNSDTEFAKTIIGTPYYLSPEMCEDQPYDNKSDIWALGCVLYEMATLRHAFDAHNLPALVLKILKGDYPPIPQVYSKDLSNLVKSMLRTDPRDRPSINEILETALVQKYLTAVKSKQLNSASAHRVPVTARKPAASSMKPSPEKLQILKLKNEPKAKSKENVPKENVKKVNASPHSASPNSKPRPTTKSTNSPASSMPSTPRSNTPNMNLNGTSPRSRTPPAPGTPPLTPRSQQNSPRPYSSPAISHRSINNPNSNSTSSPSSKSDSPHVPTPRPPATPTDKKVMTHQRAKSEPLKRTVALTSGSRKPSSPASVPSAPPKPSPIGAKKRAQLKIQLELKQHEQKFKDNLKSVKARIARDNKPFQNAAKPEEPLSPTSAATSQLLFIVPPLTPPSNGTVSAPVTPRRAPAHDARTIASARSPATSSSPASAHASPATRENLRATSSASSASAIKAAAQAHATKQKSATAKTESLKDVIKKSRRQIKKEGGVGEELSVEIMVPKHMEHLLRTTPDMVIAAQEEPDLEASEPKEEGVEQKTESAEKETGKEKEEENDKCEELVVENIENGAEERVERRRAQEDQEDKEEEACREENVNTNDNVSEIGEIQDVSPKDSFQNVRFSTDLSKMDKLSIRIETLRQKCEQVFGEETFFKVYKYLREMKQDADDKEIQNTLHKMVGGKLAYLRYVDQLIFCELQFYGS